MSTSGDKRGTRRSRSGSVIFRVDTLKDELNRGSDNLYNNYAWNAAVNRLKMYCKAYGLVYNEPDYSGNSFFEAVSDQLSFLGSPYQGSILELRLDTVNVIKQVLKDSIDSEVKAYLNNMKEPETRADHYVVYCMAQLLQRDILIIRSYPETNVRVLRVEGADNPDTEPIVLGYSNKYRFHSLTPVDKIINPTLHVHAQVLTRPSTIRDAFSRTDDAYMNAAQEQVMQLLKKMGSDLGYDFMISRKVCILHAIAEQLRSRFYPNQPKKLYSRVAASLRKNAKGYVSPEELETFIDRIKCETDEDCGSQCSAFNNITKTAKTALMTAYVLFVVTEIIGHDINIVLIKEAPVRATILQVRANPTPSSSTPLILGHVFGQQFLIMEPSASTLYSTIGHGGQRDTVQSRNEPGEPQMKKKSTTKGRGLVTRQTPIESATRTSASPTTTGQVSLTGHGGQRETVQSQNEPGEPPKKKKSTTKGKSLVTRQTPFESAPSTSASSTTTGQVSLTGTTKGRGFVKRQTPIESAPSTSASSTTTGQVSLTGHGGQRDTAQSRNEPGEPQVEKKKQDEIVRYRKKVKKLINECEEILHNRVRCSTLVSLDYGLNRLQEMEMDILDTTGKLLTKEDGNHVLAPLRAQLQTFRREINTCQLAPLTQIQKGKVREVLDRFSGDRAEVIATSRAFTYTLTKEDMLLLHPRGWLNDQIINYYMQLIQLRGQRKGLPTVHSFSSFLYAKLQKRHNVRKWIETDIFENDILVMPMSVNGNHRCLTIIDFKTKSLRYFDSLGGSAVNFQTLRNFLDQESQYWREESFDFEDWKNEIAQGIPQQENPNDCGVFVCVYAKYATRRLQMDFNQNNIPNFRSRMVYELTTNTIQ